MSAPVFAAATAAPFNPLLVMILVPLIGAAVVALMPKARADLVRQVAVIFSLISGASSLYLLSEFVTKQGDFQFELRHAWMKSFGISWHFGVEGISLFLLVLTGVLFTLAIVAVDPGHDHKPYYAWLLVLMAGSMGVFVALDLVVFFLFFEIVLVPMYFLIGLWGHGDRIYAATKFFLYTMFGSALMLVGIVATAYLHQRGTGGDWTFDVVEIASKPGISTGASRWIFASFALAFAVKVPLFPLHTWLPDAHTEAPTAGSVILAGVMLKLGTYGFVRFGLYLFPEASRFFAPVLLTLGVIGIIWGAICATMQKDLKRLVAYSSVAHLGFIVLGTFSLTKEGIEGAVLQMVNHGITTPALFLLVGMIYERRHTRNIDELGGLQVSAPILAGFFTLAMLASVGLPGLNGFPGEFLALAGAFKGARWWAVVAASGVILAALYLLWAYQRVFHGAAEGDNATMRDLRLVEGLVLAPLCALIIVLGVYPKVMLDRIEPSVTALVEHMQHAEGGGR
ncbi:MAG TPA: NADH-quinone oxidoreductase subunit M [Microthrixaceae bacterium]|nr:NADH-quinone oxidoreductase subunit M [Microthrixaceae bacterium]